MKAVDLEQMKRELAAARADADLAQKAGREAQDERDQLRANVAGAHKALDLLGVPKTFDLVAMPPTMPGFGIVTDTSLSARIAWLQQLRAARDALSKAEDRENATTPVTFVTREREVTTSLHAEDVRKLRIEREDLQAKLILAEAEVAGKVARLASVSAEVEQLRAKLAEAEKAIAERTEYRYLVRDVATREQAKIQQAVHDALDKAGAPPVPDHRTGCLRAGWDVRIAALGTERAALKTLAAKVAAERDACRDAAQAELDQQRTRAEAAEAEVALARAEQAEDRVIFELAETTDDMAAADEADAELRTQLAAVVTEWRRGCSNVDQHHRHGVPVAPEPGGCQECTAAAMRAVASCVDERQAQGGAS